GVIAPAGPGVLIGRGRGFAMTITSGILDNIDTFVEFLDPARPDHYLFRGRSRPLERRTETFAVAGQPAVTLEVLRTVHGPVFFIDREEGLAYSRQAAFVGKELESAAALVALGFVSNLHQFERLANRVAVSLNLHYADAAGNIAYFHRGIRPLRPFRTDPRLPLDGRGTMEWRGGVPPRRLPSVVNPEQGFITNWNNKPVAGWPAGEQRELWGVVDRVQVFTDALTAARATGTKLTIADVKALMRRAATSDIFAARVVPFLEDAVAGSDPNGPLALAVGRVRAWVDAGASLVAVPDRPLGGIARRARERAFRADRPLRHGRSDALAAAGASRELSRPRRDRPGLRADHPGAREPRVLQPRRGARQPGRRRDHRPPGR